MKNLSSLASLPEIVQCKEDFQRHFERIDKFQLVLNAINQDLTTLEQNVAKSEEELGFNNTGLKGLLKPWFGMSSGSSATTRSDRLRTEEGLSEHPSYQYSLSFNSSEYFGDAHNET